MGKDWGEYNGTFEVRLDKLYGNKIPNELEAFIVDEEMNLTPVEVKVKDSLAQINISVNKRTELILGPKGMAKKQFFYGS